MRRVPKETKALWLDLLRESASLVSAWEKRDTPVDSLINEAAKFKSSTGSFLRLSETFSGPAHLRKWLIDPQLNGVRNHESREFKPSDLLRYFYFSVHAASSTDPATKPNMLSIPALLKPDHANVDTGHFSDRFRVQLKDKPAKTITCHLGKDGHAFIHYDPAQCRALTVREAARLQTFPDNYIFCGPVSEQRKQVGNAVPPWFAVQLAGLVHSLLDLGASGQRKKIA
jgi:DNA (cytosine-5)-methyltransferase 1